MLSLLLLGLPLLFSGMIHKKNQSEQVLVEILMILSICIKNYCANPCGDGNLLRALER